MPQLLDVALMLRDAASMELGEYLKRANSEQLQGAAKAIVAFIGVLTAIRAFASRDRRFEIKADLEIYKLLEPEWRDARDRVRRLAEAAVKAQYPTEAEAHLRGDDRSRNIWTVVRIGIVVGGWASVWVLYSSAHIGWAILATLFVLIVTFTWK